MVATCAPLLTFIVLLATRESFLSDLRAYGAEVRVDDPVMRIGIAAVVGFIALLVWFLRLPRTNGGRGFGVNLPR
jgi:hypothetical protein